MAIEDVTRGDLEQMFESHTEKIINEMDKRFTDVDRQFSQASDERAEIRTTIDRLDRRTDEEIRDVYNRLEVLEKLNGVVQEKVIQAE